MERPLEKMRTLDIDTYIQVFWEHRENIMLLTYYGTLGTITLAMF